MCVRTGWGCRTRAWPQVCIVLVEHWPQGHVSRMTDKCLQNDNDDATLLSGSVPSSVREWWLSFYCFHILSTTTRLEKLHLCSLTPEHMAVKFWFLSSDPHSSLPERRWLTHALKSATYMFISPFWKNSVSYKCVIFVADGSCSQKKLWSGREDPTFLRLWLKAPSFACWQGT